MQASLKIKQHCKDWKIRDINSQQSFTQPIPNQIYLKLPSTPSPNHPQIHITGLPQFTSKLPLNHHSFQQSEADNQSYKQNVKKQPTNSKSNNGESLLHQQRQAYSPYPNLFVPFARARDNLSGSDKARMIREINLKIQLLQSKSKQPGVLLEDLSPLKEEIYNKFDQYYISNQLITSRIIDGKGEVKDYKKAAFPSRIRKGSQEISHGLKGDQVSPRSSIQRQSSLQDKPYSSKVVLYNEEGQVINSKTYKTMANISVASHIKPSGNNEEDDQRPVFQTQLSQKELLELDRSPERKMSEQSDELDESYMQLKENVRIMEERICFLIHRLEDNKKEIVILRDGRDKLEKKSYERQKANLELTELKQVLFNRCLCLEAENQQLKQRLEKEVRDGSKLEKEIAELERSIGQSNTENEYLSQRLRAKESELVLAEQLLNQKRAECEQITHNIRSLEREFSKKRQELVGELQEKEEEKEALRRQVSEQKARMEVEGVTLKFEEAAKLQKYIQENEQVHQREIEKLDGSYCVVISELREENLRIRNQNMEIEKALSQWLGKSESAGDFKSQGIKLEGIKMQEGSLSSGRISKEFLILLQNYSLLESQRSELIAKNQEVEGKLMVFRQEYENLLEKSSDESEKYRTQLDHLSALNHALTSENNSVASQLRELKQKQSEIDQQPPLLSHSQIISRNIEFRYPEPQLIQIASGTNFQEVIEKMSKANLKRKLEIALKLVHLAQSFANKKKMSSLNPACLTVSISPQSQRDFCIQVDRKGGEQQEQNLHYCSPEVLLGFNETQQSHCWTIGVILDRLIHGKEYFSQYSQIISRKENYAIRDQKYKSLDFLREMLRKNQKQRMSLSQVEERIRSILEISNLQ